MKHLSFLFSACFVVGGAACGDVEDATVLGAALEHGTGEPTSLVTICHIPPGNAGAAHDLDLPLAAVPAHLAHGDLGRPCDPGDTARALSSKAAKGGGGDELMICHIPPGNSGAARTLSLRLPGAEAHLAHGDLGRPCDPGDTARAARAETFSGGHTVMVCCHIPPGNAGAARTLELPLAGAAAHLRHGDLGRPCDPGDTGGTLAAAGATSDTVSICHIPRGNPGAARTLALPLAAAAAHLSHGDLGRPCDIGDTARSAHAHK